MKKFNILSRGFIGAATVACVLFAAGIVGVPYYGNNFVPDSHVDIDVNPGVEIITNKNNKVIEIQSTNKDGKAVIDGMDRNHSSGKMGIELDGKAVIDGMDLKNAELKVAVNALIGSMVQKGYIENNNTGILVTVRNNNPDKAKEIKKEVLDDINIALDKNDVKANVMNQTLKNTVDADKFAKENNISIGKAVFVLNLAAKDNTLDAKELAKMRVTDIADLIEKKGIDIKDIVDYDSEDSIRENIADAIEDVNDNLIGNTVVEVNTAKQISVDEAKKIALAHAKLAEKDVTFVNIELDYENNRPVYDVEFYSGNVEYDYDIDALTKEIVSSDFDIENYDIPVQTTAAQQETTAPSADIGIEKAKAIALAHAGLSQDKVSFVKAELDYEDGIKVYDIEFYSGNVEYDYEISVADGSIISADRDIENYSIPTPEVTAAPAPTKAEVSGISSEKAKQIALSHAGVGSANFTKVQLDTEDGIRVYEIEFKVGNVEYEYDIDASTGAIVSSSSEIDD